MGTHAVMYLQSLKRVLSTSRGLRLTFSAAGPEEQVELSQEAAAQTLRALQGACSGAGEGPLTLGVLGHQVVRRGEAYGLLLRTQELGDVVFALPPAVLDMLVVDLMHLASSLPARPTSPAGKAGRTSGKSGARQSQGR
jgi:hypothetical protein